MKVFCFVSTDWIVAETIEEATKFYSINFEEIQESDLKEVNLTDCMWYGFDWGDKNIERLIAESDRIFKTKKDPRGEFAFSIQLTFEEVIYIDKITKPYLISSTEF